MPIKVYLFASLFAGLTAVLLYALFRNLWLLHFYYSSDVIPGKVLGVRYKAAHREEDTVQYEYSVDISYEAGGRSYISTRPYYFGSSPQEGQVLDVYVYRNKPSVCRLNKLSMTNICVGIVLSLFFLAFLLIPMILYIRSGGLHRMGIGDGDFSVPVLTAITLTNTVSRLAAGYFVVSLPISLPIFS